MDTTTSYEKAQREMTLVERIEALEAHHEETRKRMYSLEERLRHQRERIDRVFGSEPEVAELPVPPVGSGWRDRDAR